jgi:hypothetical protein
MSILFGQKTRFFWRHILCDHYALVFYNKTCKIILLFFRFELHKSQKISRKWTSSMSKIEIDETFL